MAKYVIKRLILAFITAIIIITITFFLIKLLPFEKPVGTYAERYSYYMHQVSLGFLQYSIDEPMPQLGDYIEKIQLDKDSPYYYFYETPIFTQYASWMRNIITKWDWGVSLSIQPNVDAMAIIFGRLPVTIRINFWSVIFSVPLGIALGIWAALKKNKPTDHIISTSVMVLVAVPSFVLITFVLLIFCYTLHWFPTQWPNPDPNGQYRTVDFLAFFVPVFVLSLGSICGYCRAVRAELCEVMESEYLLLARTKGLTKRQAIIRHALRNAMVPIVPSILAEVIGLLGGSMILENLYGIPGIGSLYIDSINAKDFNVLFVDMAFFEVISLLAGIVLDLSYGFIDPRIRMGAKNK